MAAAVGALAWALVLAWEQGQRWLLVRSWVALPRWALCPLHTQPPGRAVRRRAQGLRPGQVSLVVTRSDLLRNVRGPTVQSRDQARSAGGLSHRAAAGETIPVSRGCQPCVPDFFTDAAAAAAIDAGGGALVANWTMTAQQPQVRMGTARYWRRRADSNRRIGVLQTPALDHLATSPR